MAKGEVSIQNFAAGELSPKMYGRWNLPVFQNGCEILKNFIIQTQGPATYRNGFRFVNHTRRNKKANLIKFQFSNSQSYTLEFTDGYMRVYRDDGQVLESNVTITGATTANPVVITTSGAHGYSNGDEVFISGVGGMTQINGKFFLVNNVTATTFELQDQDGVNVDGTSFAGYSSGGTVAKVFEITTPYLEADDLFLLRTAQNADTMYIVHPCYEPRKLTRSGHTSWTLALFTRTADPFLDKKNLTAATQANPCVVTTATHGYSTGDQIIIEGVVGMTELNGKKYTITVTGATTFELDGVDSTGFTAYSSGGYASKITLLPSVVTFYESRTWYSGIPNEPLALKASRTPDNNGAGRYDDFTNGTSDDHAIEITLAAEDESAIQNIKGNEKFLATGAFSGIYKATGNRDDEAITPTSIKIRRVSSVGVSNIAPLSLEGTIVYAERQKLTVRSFEYDALLDNFSAKDRNLTSDHITAGLIKEFAWQSGRPDVAWAVKEDGELIGMTFKASEDVNGWFRVASRTGDTFISIATVPRTSAFDRLWAVIEREIDGTTRRYVEYMEDPAVIPVLEDFFTGEANEATDDATFRRAMFEAQKEYVHLDSAISYDGSDSSNSTQTMTPGAVTGTSITFTAGGAIFTSADVGREIWKKAINGVGKGRAVITAFNSATSVDCTIKEDFDNTNVIAAGNWFFTTNSITNLDHLEGESIGVITDGAVHPVKTVTNGLITLDYQASKVHVGLKYIGILKTTNLEIGGVGGPGQTKPKNVFRLGIRFEKSLGTKYGTKLYDMHTIVFRSAQDAMDRVPPLFTGDKRLPVEDSNNEQKHLLVLQNEGLPCTVQLLMAYAETSNK